MPGWNGGPYNLKTMVGNYVLADEQGVPTSMGKYYDLPVFGLGGSTDAKVLDHQAGMECTISLMTALLHGANIVHDVGFMDSGLQGSLQLQVMANETIGFCAPPPGVSSWMTRPWPWMPSTKWDPRAASCSIPIPCVITRSRFTLSCSTRDPIHNGRKRAV